MKPERFKELAEQIAGQLGNVDSFLSHGAAIDADEATRLGLQIEKLEPRDPLWQACWRLWCQYDLEIRRQSYRYVFEGRKASITWPGQP